MSPSPCPGPGDGQGEYATRLIVHGRLEKIKKRQKLRTSVFTFINPSSVKVLISSTDISSSLKTWNSFRRSSESSDIRVTSTLFTQTIKGFLANRGLMFSNSSTYKRN